MVRILFFMCSLMAAIPAWSQGKFERKIIIVDSVFYAVEIENQAGKLYVGRVNEPMSNARVYALPAGTKRRALNFLPFAWDISNDTIYAVNFTEHPENSRLTSLKSIPVKGLPDYDPDKTDVQLRKAGRENSMTYNLPLINTVKKYMYMDYLFFDVLMKDDVLYQFISVNDELVVWSYVNDEWKESEMFPFDARSYFAVYVESGEIYLVNSKGEIFRYRGKPELYKSMNFPLSEKTMIIDRDHDEVNFVTQAVFDQTSLSLEEILNKYSKN